MTNILARQSRELLSQLAWARVLLAFDFDGTLAPIVDNRGRAAMRASTRRLFRQLCEAYPCAVISGRARADVVSRLAGARVRFVMGNHGLEPGASVASFERKVKQALPVLARALREVPGIDIEDKRYSLAVHYRRARRKRSARNAIHALVPKLPVRMRLVPGKCVVNLVPEEAPDKGDALLGLRERAGADTALYVGDDATDEDVFRLDQPGRLLTIRVGESKTSSAAYFIRSQRDVDTLLERLLRSRSHDA